MKTKNKTGITTTNALEPLMRRNRPKKIQVDGGSEFFNRWFIALTNELNIKMYWVHSDRKAPIVERVNRTLKTRMYKYFTSHGTEQWYDVLDDLVAGYNNTVHRSIKCTPNEVNLANEDIIRRRLFPPLPPRKKPKLKVGDLVRTNRFKNIFKKAYEKVWTHEVYRVIEVKNTNPVTYAIEDLKSETIDGSYYEADLQLVDKTSDTYEVERVVRTRLYRTGRRYFIKWAGFDDRFNSWISEPQFLALRDAD